MNRVHLGPAKTVASILFLILHLFATCEALPAIPVEGGNASVEERAGQLARAGNVEQAVKLLQAALAAHPAELAARLALGDLYATNGDADKAEQEFREALRRHPGSSSAELALGRFYNNVGRLDAAEQVLEDAIRRNPKLAEAHEELALVLARERKYAEAESNIRLVPAPAAPNARVRYFRLAASIHSGLGDSDAAAHAMEEALHVVPSDEDLQLGTSVAEAEAGEWQACLRNIGPLYKRRPTPVSGLVLLRAQLATHEDFTSTLQSLRAMNLPEGQRLQLRTRSAEILAAAGKHVEAVQELQGALKLGGGETDGLLYNLAVEQYRLRQFDAAFATLAPLRSQQDSAEIEDLAGDIAEQRGDPLGAAHAYQNAISLAPGEERYRLSLGAELLKYRDYEPAVLVFKQAAELFPESARINVGLGMAYYFMEKYDDSVTAFLHADKLAPGSTLAVGYLGATQARRPDGPLPAAIAALCGHADSNAPDPTAVAWCGALLFRKAYVESDYSAAPEAIRRLRMAASLAPDNPVADCTLGDALSWTEEWGEARHWLEVCVRLQPDSGEDHFQLSRVYRKLGLTREADEQAAITGKANAEQDQREALAKKFVYEIVSQPKRTVDAKPADSK